MDLVLIGRTASSQKIQRSLPAAVLLWLVKGKERGRTDKFSADLVRRQRLRPSLHVDAINRRKEELSTYWANFETYVAPRCNFKLARYKVRTIKQEPSETVDPVIKKLHILVKECKYIKPNDHIIDALISGSNNPRVQSVLLEHDNTLTLDSPSDRAEKLCTASTYCCPIQSFRKLS